MSVHREPGLAVADVPSDTDREIEGYIATWDEHPAGIRLAGKDSAANLTLDRHSFDRWLSTVDPAAIPIVVDHDESAPVGRWLAFRADSTGLRGIGEVDESPAGDMVLAAIHLGVTPGLSFQARNLIVDADTAVQLGENLRSFDVLEVELVEAGPSLDPADRGAVIDSVCRERPRFRRREDLLERDRAWRQRRRLR